MSGGAGLRAGLGAGPGAGPSGERPGGAGLGGAGPGEGGPSGAGPGGRRLPISKISSSVLVFLFPPECVVSVGVLWSSFGTQRLFIRRFSIRRQQDFVLNSFSHPKRERAFLACYELERVLSQESECEDTERQG